MAEVDNGSEQPEVGLQQVDKANPLSNLSERQLTIIDLTSQGFSYTETAAEINCSPKYTRNLRWRILQTLGARNMVHVVRIGCDAGVFDRIIEPAPHGARINPTLAEILDVSSYGNNCTETGDQLNRAAKTIRNYRSDILFELGARTFSHAVRIAFQEGILPLEADTVPVEVTE